MAQDNLRDSSTESMDRKSRRPLTAVLIGLVTGVLIGVIGWGIAGSRGVSEIHGIPGIGSVPLPVLLLLLAAVAAVLVILVLWPRQKGSAAEGTQESAAEADDSPSKSISRVIMTSDAGEIYAPLAGRVVSYTEIPDETFASGVLGEGVGIWPEEEFIYAPFDGSVSTVAESKHAIGLTGNGDMELLIHVGVDTVAMSGEGFTPFVKEGEQVTRGQKLLHFDRKTLRAAGYPDMVVVLLTNSEDMTHFRIKL